MTVNDDQQSSVSVSPDGISVGVTELGKAVIALDPRTKPIDYSGLNFKEMLLACPIDDIDLERQPEPPRPIDL